MNTVDTITNSVNTHINDLLRNTVLPIIITYINENYEDMDLSVQELEDVLLLNNIKYQTNKKNVEFFCGNQKKQCNWKYKRGKDKDYFCQKNALVGSDYCFTCSKRPALIKKP